MDVLLLGNGFDLHYNLPTKYQNFLHVVDWLIHHYNADVMTIADVFGDEELQKDDPYLSNCFNLYREICSNVALDSAKIKQIIDVCVDNIWFGYLLHSYNQDLGWIDFEREIDFVCKSFNKMIKYGSFAQLTGKDIVTVTFENDVFTLAERLTVSSLLKFWVDKTDYVPPKVTIPRFWIKKEYTREFPHHTKHYECDSDAMVSYMIKQLEEFAKSLKLYLQVFSDGLCAALVKNGKIQKLPLEGDDIVTLNYTKTYEMVFGKGNVYHIHGNTDGAIVLGVNSNADDDFETSDTTFIRFKKYFQRVLYRTDLEYLDWLCQLDRMTKHEETRNANLFVDLYVIGHSLDVTDAEIIRELFDYSDRITIFSHSDQATSDYIAHLIEIFGKKEFDILRFKKTLIFAPYGDEGSKIIQDHQCEKLVMAVST